MSETIFSGLPPDEQQFYAELAKSAAALRRQFIREWHQARPGQRLSSADNSSLLRKSKQIVLRPYENQSRYSEMSRILSSALAARKKPTGEFPPPSVSKAPSASRPLPVEASRVQTSFAFMGGGTAEFLHHEMGGRRGRR